MSLLARLVPFALLLMTGCSTASLPTAECPEPAPSAMTTQATNLVNMISVVPVKDHAAATAWYGAWLGREADIMPAEGVAEWQLVGEAWLQVAVDPEHAGETTVVVGVKDLAQQRAACEAAGITLGEPQDYGVVLLAEAIDPDGNKVAFVQQVGGE